MKVVAYDDSPKEKEIRLKLRQDADGVTLTAVDQNGKHVSGGSLILFNNDGRVIVCDCVSEDIGFQLDVNGRLVLTNE